MGNYSYEGTLFEKVKVVTGYISQVMVKVMVFFVVGWSLVVLIVVEKEVIFVICVLRKHSSKKLP